MPGTHFFPFGIFLIALVAISAISTLTPWGEFHRAQAAVPFSYDRRAKDFSGWTAAARGDINTIGMAGSTLATASSISAAEANSAGFAMQTSSISAQINKVSIDDKRIQLSGEPIESRQWGLSLSPPPWGFSIAYYSPMTESGDYISPLTGHSLRSEVSLKQFRLTVARAFFEERLSLGLSVEAVKAVRELGSFSYNSFGLGYRVGALYRLPGHLVLGATYAPEISVKPVGEAALQQEMPDFNRAVILPAQIGVGVGWMPNRFFKAGVSLTYVAPTRNTALLGDQGVATGVSPTLVPRLGASYVMAEYRNFKAEWAAGTYYEASRLEGHGDRIHGTTAIEVNPYFVNLGVGGDIASDYKNLIFSIGLDIVRTLRTFDIIPKDPVPPYNGFFPKPQKVSADGLPSGLTKGEKQRYQAPSVEDVGGIIKNIPQKIEDKFSKSASPRRKKRKLKNATP